jgi:membrane-bound lytic murein transglycosylase F
MKYNGSPIKFPQAARTWTKVFAILLLLLAFLAGIYFYRRKPGKSDDFQQILDKKELTVLTMPGSMSCFIYNGKIRGYEYESVSDFAARHKLRLNVKLADSETQLTEWLKSDAGNLIACNIPITEEGKKQLIYCGREIINEQVLIQRANRKDTLLTDVVDLIGREVRLVRDSKYHRRMASLNRELGGGIRIRTDSSGISTEDLIEMVSQGKILYTVCDMDLAKLSKAYFGNINITLVVGHPQRASWAVKKSMPQLAKAIDSWAKTYTDNPKRARINKRYFEISKNHPPVDSIPKGNQISPFDDLFKTYANLYGLDWRLLAAIAFQESNFLPNCSSRAGAAGLMGLMPRTAQSLGLSEDRLYDPEQNIKTACKLLMKLGRHFTGITDKTERMRFVLGAYNAGQAHIMDAQSLAGKYGGYPYRWEEIAPYLLLKSSPEYYNDPVCTAGYLRGTETVKYVAEIMKRWKYYTDPEDETLSPDDYTTGAAH